MATCFDDFSAAKSFIHDCLEDALCTQDAGASLEEQLEQAALPKDIEKKHLFDQAFRDLLLGYIDKKKSTEEFKALITLSIYAVKQELCVAALPFIMLSDLFDSITLDKCDSVFQFIEEKVAEWKSWDTFYNSGKNYLLRMCNDLLRRLSKSHNTVFCGRIQLFLARLFPLSEKSGLNLMSQFNLENVTLYTTKSEDYDKARKMSMEAEKDDDMEIEEGETDDSNSSIPIDYNLYRKFWALQDYFRKPTQCYDKMAWKTFSNYSEEVLSCFENFKLDDVKCKSNSMFMDADTFFAKYLTSEKLLDLQLSDTNFRRYVLVQFIILFQYLNAEVKFKNSNQVLTEEQSGWVKQCSERVGQILRDTPPDGQQFAEGIEHILNREENWNSWKNESCQSYVRLSGEEDAKPQFTRGPRKRALGDDIKASGNKLLKMGNPELTRLWNLNQDNLGACKDQKRNHLPTADIYFEDSIEQLDPESEVDEEYLYIRNSNYAWKSLRLLARRSPHFFAQQTGGPSANQNKTLHKYLEATLAKMVKERNQASTSQTEAEIKADAERGDGPHGAGDGTAGEEEDDDVGGADQDESALNDKDDSPKTQEEEEDDMALLVSKDQLESLAEEIKGDWSKLATELNFPDDDITYIANESDDTAKQALKMLTIWRENEGDKASLPSLRAALKEIGEVAAADKALGAEES